MVLNIGQIECPLPVPSALLTACTAGVAPMGGDAINAAGASGQQGQHLYNYSHVEEHGERMRARRSRSIGRNALILHRINVGATISVVRPLGPSLAS